MLYCKFADCYTRGVQLKRRTCSLWLYFWTSGPGMGLKWKINHFSSYWCVKSTNFLLKWLQNRQSKTRWSRNPYQIFDFWARVGKQAFTKIFLIVVRFSNNFRWYISNHGFSIGLIKSFNLLLQLLAIVWQKIATLGAFSIIFQLICLDS